MASIVFDQNYTELKHNMKNSNLIKNANYLNVSLKSLYLGHCIT